MGGGPTQSPHQAGRPPPPAPPREGNGSASEHYRSQRAISAGGLRAFGRCRDGAAILEFALVLPILVALVFGCFELGRALLVYRTMGEAARAGARSLARVPDPTCRPACSPGAARALALALDQIAENARLPRRAISVSAPGNPPDGMVAVEAEVALATDLLGALGLDRLLTLRITQFEARLGR